MIVKNEAELMRFAARMAAQLQGGEVIELIGDVGAGKTTFTKGIARGLGISEAIQSPTFTISREYVYGTGRRLVHYDFYRLSEAGIMRDELAEAIDDPRAVIVVEWSDVASDVLPEQRVIVHLSAVADDEQARLVTVTTTAELAYVTEGIV